MRHIKKSAALAMTLIGIFVWHFARSYKSRTNKEPQPEELLAAEKEGRNIAKNLIERNPHASRGQLIKKIMAAVPSYLRTQAKLEEK